MINLQQNNLSNRFIGGIFSFGIFLILIGQSIPSIEYLGGHLNIEQIILCSMLPLLLFVRKYGVFNKDRIIFLLVFGLLIWISLANVYLKSPTYGNLRVIKNVILVIAVSYYLCINLINNKIAFWWLIKSIVLGSVIFLFFVFIYIDFSGTLFRPIQGREFVHLFGVSYIWIGYISGIVVIFSFLLLLNAKNLTKILWLLCLFIGVIGLILSGTRAAIIALPVSVVLTIILNQRMSKIALFVFYMMISLLVLTAVYSGPISYMVPNPSISPEFREGTYRFILIDNWLSALQTRLQDWDAISPTFAFYDAVAGVEDYDKSISQARVLGHPHNAFVLMYMLGGIVALVLFSILLVYIFKITYSLNYNESDLINNHFPKSLFCSLILTIFIMVTNGLITGIPLMFGILLALVDLQTKFNYMERFKIMLLKHIKYD
jgi:O-antigen ligase